jgi:hypothetical protein
LDGQWGILGGDEAAVVVGYRVARAAGRVENDVDPVVTPRKLFVGKMLVLP